MNTNTQTVCHVLIESFGPVKIRLTMKAGQNDISHNLFANLAWACGSEANPWEIENFITSREKVAGAIKAFRCGNVTQERRGRGLWKQSPFRFYNVEQRNDTRAISIEGCGVGCYQDTKETWEGYKPRIAKHFDKVEA